jgi:hypothetical protein
MADLTQERNTVQRASVKMLTQNVLNMPAGAVAYKGLLKAADANQRAVNPSGANAALFVMGAVKKTVDNSLGANDEQQVELETGPMEFDNDGSIGVDDVGKPCYAVDNHTVSITQALGSLAGKILQVNATGVEVDVARP